MTQGKETRGEKTWRPEERKQGGEIGPEGQGQGEDRKWGGYQSINDRT